MAFFLFEIFKKTIDNKIAIAKLMSIVFYQNKKSS